MTTESTSQSTLSGEDVMITPKEQLKIYEKTFEQYIDDMSMDVSVYRTTVMIPIEVRSCALAAKNRVGQKMESRIFRSLIEHGFSIIEHKFKNRTKEIQSISYNYRSSQCAIIRKLILTNNFSISSSEDPQRCNIQINEKIWNALITFSETFRVSNTALIIMCICYSLDTFDHLSEFESIWVRHKIDTFELLIFEMIAMFRSFEYVESQYNKLLEECKTEQE